MTTQHITSRQNARVKEAAKLRMARQRDRQERFVIDGTRELLRAMASGIEIVEAFICEPRCVDDETQRAASMLSQTAAVVATVTEEVFEKLCFGERTGGVLAIARTPVRTLDQLELPAAPLIAVIEGVEKPGNVGAVLRSADGAGVDAVVIADPRTDLFNPNTIRASLGTVFDANVCTATSGEVQTWLRTLGVPMFAARPDATQLYTEVDYRQRKDGCEQRRLRSMQPARQDLQSCSSSSRDSAADESQKLVGPRLELRQVRHELPVEVRAFSARCRWEPIVVRSS